MSIKYYFKDKKELVDGFALVKLKLENILKLEEFKQVKNNANEIVEEYAHFRINKKDELPYFIVFYDLEIKDGALLLVYNSPK